MCCLVLTCFYLVPVLLWREIWGQQDLLESHEPCFLIGESLKNSSCGDLLSNTTGILVECIFLVTCIHFVTLHGHFMISKFRLQKTVTFILLTLFFSWLVFNLMKQPVMFQPVLWWSPPGKELSMAFRQQLERSWGSQCNSLWGSESCQQSWEWAWKWVLPQLSLTWLQPQPTPWVQFFMRPPTKRAS